MLRTPCLALAVLAGTTLSSPAAAVLDATGDFLSTYAGPRAPDLDINAAEAFRSVDTFHLISSHVDDPGLTPGSSVTWGINRGAGTPRLFTADLPVGPKVLFDAVVTIQPRGPITLIVFNEKAPPTITELDDRAPFNDTLLAAIIPHDLLPSRGFALADYSFNVWTRAGPGSSGIADFARDSNFGVVPEPASWAMLIVGFGLVGKIARRRVPSVSKGSVRRCALAAGQPF